MVVFWGEGKPEYPEKTSRCREEDQQTQPTFDAGSGNRTQATLVGGECSYCLTIPAPPRGEFHYVLRSSARLVYSLILLLDDFLMPGGFEENLLFTFLFLLMSSLTTCAGKWADNLCPMSHWKCCKSDICTSVFAKVIVIGPSGVQFRR